MRFVALGAEEQKGFLPDIPDCISSECFFTGLEWNPLRVLLLVLQDISHQEEYEPQEVYLNRVGACLDSPERFHDFLSLLELVIGEADSRPRHTFFTAKGLERDWAWRLIRKEARPIYEDYARGRGFEDQPDSREFYQELRNLVRLRGIIL